MPAPPSLSCSRFPLCQPSRRETSRSPKAVDQPNSSQPSYHVWQNVNNIAKIDLPAGVYVMQFSMVYTGANFDSFTFTKM